MSILELIKDIVVHVFNLKHYKHQVHGGYSAISNYCDLTRILTIMSVMERINDTVVHVSNFEH